MLGTAFKLRHLGRYKDIAVLMGRYARAGSGREEAVDLARRLEDLGPTFIKLGQLLSTRPDVLPQAHLDALERLQDKVGPFPFSLAERTIEEDLGARPGKLFRWIDPKPAAAASLAQIHKASLRDGRLVAVKVQRPGLDAVIADDIAAIEEAAGFLDRHTEVGRRYEFSRLLEEFGAGLRRELDYDEEARSLRRLGEALETFDKLVIPRPHEDFTGGRVLTMDWIEGRKITALSPLALNEIDGPPLASQLFRAYLRQFLVDGFFHADPHPGNIVLSGKKVAILDLGMTGRLGPDFQQDLLGLFLAISDGRSDDAATFSIRIGRRREGFAEAEYRAKVSRLVLDSRESTISQLNLGRVIFEMARLAGAHGLRQPAEMTMVSKALLNLDQVVTTLDPDFEPAAAVREEASVLFQDRLARAVSSGGAASALLDAQKFAQKLPERVGRALDVLGRQELRVKVDAVDERLLIDGMQKIANRIALGVVLASLIIGAALLMRVETSFRIFEYPGLAIILFLGAAVAGLVLIADILRYDEGGVARSRGAEVEIRD